MDKSSTSAGSKHRMGDAKKLLRHHAIVKNASARAGRPGEDYGTDNFSFDPEKVGKWRMPDHIASKNLPKELREASKDWTLAGAAIDTAIERIKDLKDEASWRALPVYSHGHLMASQRSSERALSVDEPSIFSLSQLYALPASSTPATSFTQSECLSPPPKLNTKLAFSKQKYVVHPNQLPESITSKPGMESPPFTPITRSGSDSGSGARSPAMLPNGLKDDMITPDFIKLSAQLSPLMSPSSASFASTCSDFGEVKPDKLAWSNYIGAYQAELYDLTHRGLPRLQGHRYTVQKLLVELHTSPPADLTWESAEAVFAFAAWWNDTKDMGVAKEDVLAVQTMPTIEDVVAGA